MYSGRKPYLAVFKTRSDESKDYFPEGNIEIFAVPDDSVAIKMLAFLGRHCKSAN